MSFAPGDWVHFAGLGTGTIREVRGGGRYAVAIKGRIVIAAVGDLELAEPPTKPGKHRAAAPVAPSRPARPHPPSLGSGLGRATAGLRPAASIDLHGMMVDEAIAAVEVFVNDALLAGQGEARVIHGRSGGRLKVALHRYLRGLRAVESFRVDPRNPGVTIVTFA